MKKLSLILIPMFVSSCGVFQPVRDDSVRHLLDATVPTARNLSSSPSVAVARPSLPSYLDRSEMVSRTGASTLDIHERLLWAESLDKGISRVVAENLRHLKKSTNIQPVGNFVSRDYTTLVEIRIDRFETDPDGMMVLECTWKAQPLSGGDVSMKPYRVSLPIEKTVGAGEKEKSRARVAAMNEALAGLCREISKDL